eukprot:scaffold23695_cov147-Cylindrotheca_fusiformis.AAC.2
MPLGLIVFNAKPPGPLSTFCKRSTLDWSGKQICLHSVLPSVPLRLTGPPLVSTNSLPPTLIAIATGSSLVFRLLSPPNESPTIR